MVTTHVATTQTRRGIRRPFYLGRRRLLAMTCVACGIFKKSADFGRRSCKGGSYIDRRCRTCRWAKMALSLSR